MYLIRESKEWVSTDSKVNPTSAPAPPRLLQMNSLKFAHSSKLICLLFKTATLEEMSLDGQAPFPELESENCRQSAWDLTVPQGRDLLANTLGLQPPRDNPHRLPYHKQEAAKG